MDELINKGSNNYLINICYVILCNNYNSFNNIIYYLGGSSWDSDDYSYSQNSQDHTSYRQRPDSYHSATQESNASQVRPYLLCT